MEKIITLINPILKRVEEIKESIYPRQFSQVGNEKMFYGTFEKSFEIFSINSIREGKIINQKDYYNNLLKELNTIENSIIELENNINRENSLNIKYLAIFSFIHKVKETINYKIETSKDTKLNSTSRINSNKLTYKWLINKSKIKRFKKKLIEYNYISKMSLDDFEYIFLEKPIENIKSPVKWKNDIATQLLYLIIELQNNDIIEIKKRTFDYSQLKECFKKNDGKDFTENFKSLKTNIEINTSKDFKGFTRKLINELKK